MLLEFPNPDTLTLAISSGTVPENIVAAPVRSTIDQEEKVWVEFDASLSRSATEQLKNWGTSVRRGKGKLAGQFREYESWLQLVPLQKEAQLTQVGDRSQVLFELLDESLLPDLVNEILRQGNDRQSVRKVKHDGSTRILLRVIGAPYYSLLRATEQCSQGKLLAYVEHSPRVWIEAGYIHPHAARISPHSGQHLLIQRNGDWRTLKEQPFQDIYSQAEFSLPEHPDPIQKSGRIPKLRVPVHLTRNSNDDSGEIFVLTEDASAQLDQFVRTSSDSVLDRLAFAVSEIANGEDPTIIVRIRPGRTAPPVLVFDGLACRNFLKIPNLFVPIGRRIHPPLRRDAVRELLAPDESQLVWLAPAPRESDTESSAITEPFVVRSIPDRAFLPLSNWVEYVLARDRETLTAWRLSHQFEFEDFICKADRKRVKKKSTPKPRHSDSGSPSTARTSTDAETESDLRVERLIQRFRSDSDGSSANAALEQIKSELKQTEQQFLDLNTPLEDQGRIPLWDTMADLNAALDRFADSSICRQHLVWHGESESSAFESWFQTDVEAAGRLGAATLSTASGNITSRGLNRVLKRRTPSPSEVAQVASWVAWSGKRNDETDLLHESLSDVQQYLEKHESVIAIRACWLAWKTLAELSEDVLLLARARDRLLDRIYQQGLTADRDLPSFLRNGGSQSDDRFRQVREKVHSLHRTIRAWSVANQATAAQTPQYADLTLAFAFARLGEQSHARELLQSAEEKLNSRDDSVHSWLLRAYQFRIETVLGGQATERTLPEDLLSGLDQMSRHDSYKISQLRNHSAILEPVEELDAYRQFLQPTEDSLEKEVTGLFAIKDSQTLQVQIRAFLNRQLSLPDQAIVRTKALELSTRIGEQFAGELLGEVVPLDRQLSDPFLRANLLEKGLQIGAHFDNQAAVQDCFSRMVSILESEEEVDVPFLEAMERLLSRSFVTLRKMGMRAEIEYLLDAMTRLVRQSRKQGDADDTGRLRILLQLAGVGFYLGQDHGWPDVDVARELLLSGKLTEEGHAGAKKQTDLAISYIKAVGQAPLDDAVTRFDDLFRNLPAIQDNASVTSHFSLKQLDIIEALVQTIVSDSFTMDSNSQRWMDEEEFLIRRRIHKDMREMMD